MGSTVFGVKIILQDKSSPVAENTTIGLYNVASDNSEFRWIQNAISGVSTWKEGVIVKNGIASFTNEIDLTRGGAVAYPGKGRVVVNNTANTWKTIIDLGIQFDGLVVELYVFYNDTPVRLRTYSCKEASNNGLTMEIPFEGIKRNANILNVVNSYQFPNAGDYLIGKTTPAVFGKSYPQIDANGVMTRASMAKFIRCQDKIDEDTYTNATLSALGTNPEIKIFPVIQYWTVNGVICGVQIELEGDAKDIGLNNTYLQDTYLLTVSGNGKNEINEVDYVFIAGGTTYNIVCKNAFKTIPSFTAGATRTWVQMIKVYRRYTDDRFPCKDFLDQNGNSTSVPQIYLKDTNDNLQRIADYGFKVSGVNKNEIDIDGSQSSTDVDTLDSFIVLPVSNFRLEDATDLAEWDTDGSNFFNGFTNKIQDGLYANKALPSGEFGVAISSTFGLLSASFAHDKNSDTYARFDSGFYDKDYVNDYWYAKVMKFDLPDIPEDIDIEGIYLGIKMHSRIAPNIWAWLTGDNRKTIRVVFKRFAYTKTTDLALYELVFDEGAAGTRYIDDVPDFYTNGTNRNDSFYRETTPVGDVYSEIKGYTLTGAFELTETDLKTYKTYKEGGLLLRRFIDHGNVVNVGGVAGTDSLDVHEICIIIKLASQSIKSDIFSPVAGRIFNNTFESRKTSSDLISKPQDFFEHVCRLQDYRDKYPTPASGWGLQYASGALIHTVSFDQIQDNREPATQIFDLDDGHTDTIKQTLCREMAIANWQDADGREHILALPTYRLNPVYTVTLDDIIDRSKIKVIDPKRETLYAEPFVKYQKNPASEEHEKYMGVKNTGATYYLPSHVEGIENAAEAQELWNTCHSLALKAHQINKPPTDMTDLKWANGPGGYTIALRHLQNWTRWQGLQEIEFPVHFTTASSWQECTPINIVMSHYTSNVNRAALVEKTETNPNHPYEIMIKAIMYA